MDIYRTAFVHLLEELVFRHFIFLKLKFGNYLNIKKHEMNVSLSFFKNLARKRLGQKINS